MSVDLSELIERVEKCSGPDRELDHAICDALIGAEQPVVLPGGQVSKGRGYRVRGNFATPVGSDPHLTSSLDAALALVEEKFPDRNLAVGTDYENRRSWAYIEDDHWDESIGNVEGFAKTPPLAVLVALLRALSNGARTESVTNEDRVSRSEGGQG